MGGLIEALAQLGLMGGQLGGLLGRGCVCDASLVSDWVGWERGRGLHGESVGGLRECSRWIPYIISPPRLPPPYRHAVILLYTVAGPLTLSPPLQTTPVLSGAHAHRAPSPPPSHTHCTLSHTHTIILQVTPALSVSQALRYVRGAPHRPETGGGFALVRWRNELRGMGRPDLTDLVGGGGSAPGHDHIALAPEGAESP